tara:strand:+ start:2105 stop:2590 length:486 start_codon:yes stop_codon:yes gene_type:complete
MEIIIFIIVMLLLITGVIGSFIPAVPGLPISYGALLLSHFYLYPISDMKYLWLMAVVVIVVTIFDFWIQVYGVKKFGGSKKAINGSIIGLIVGFLFLPAIGLIIGPFIGAFIGAKIEDSDINKAFKIALGSLAGFIAGTALKLFVSLYMIYLIYLSIPPLW